MSPSDPGFLSLSIARETFFFLWLSAFGELSLPALHPASHAVENCPVEMPEEVHRMVPDGRFEPIQIHVLSPLCLQRSRVCRQPPKSISLQRGLLACPRFGYRRPRLGTALRPPRRQHRSRCGSASRRITRADAGPFSGRTSLRQAVASRPDYRRCNSPANICSRR